LSQSDYKRFRIEICGAMGAGKTSLAMALHRQFPRSGRAILENYREVPFWEASLRRPGEFEFERDLNFLLYYYTLIKTADSSKNAICDFAFFENRAYARLSNNDADFRLFNSLYRRLERKLSPPSVILHLVCSPTTLLRRIEGRGRRTEKGITRRFLGRLTEAIEFELTRLQVERGVRTFRVETDSGAYQTAEECALAVIPSLKMEMKRNHSKQQ
jgi:deoxyguanosine kinase